MYTVRKTAINKYEVTNFEDRSIPKSSYDVTLSTQNNLECSCFGWYRQKDKLEHEHCKVVRKFMENPIPQFLEVNDGRIDIFLF